MKIQSINTAATESVENWDVKACRFQTRLIGRYSVRFVSSVAGTDVIVNCRHITNAYNAFDAVARFVRETKNADCKVYGVDELEPACIVCLNSAGYRIVQSGYIWLCLDTGVIVEVAENGTMRRGDDGRLLPAYGTLVRI
ncbi:protein TraE [Serratia odorifera]|uniref:protein TraE n=1 Tax=Serratia odorifera TaxID=618 RepID=UPI00353183FB